MPPRKGGAQINMRIFITLLPVPHNKISFILKPSASMGTALMLCVCVCVHVGVFTVCACSYVCMCVSVCVCACMHACVCECVYACIYVCVTEKNSRDANLKQVVLDQLFPQHGDTELYAELHQTASMSTLGRGEKS